MPLNSFGGGVGAASFPALCCLKADGRVRFLCSGKPVNVDEGFGGAGALAGFTVEGARSLTSPMRSKTGGTTSSDSEASSSSSERSTTKRSPRKVMLRE